MAGPKRPLTPRAGGPPFTMPSPRDVGDKAEQEIADIIHVGNLAIQTGAATAAAVWQQMGIQIREKAGLGESGNRDERLCEWCGGNLERIRKEAAERRREAGIAG